MSKRDFSDDEFAARRASARAAIAAAGLDWFVVFHPVPIRWLTGSDAKSYQEFQCLLISARPGPISVITRDGERNEFLAAAHVDEIATWGGGRTEDPIPAFERFIAPHGLLRARVGMDAPAYYLHPHHYVRIRDLLGPALIGEFNALLHDLTLVKSPAELAYIRRAARIADEAMEIFAGALAPGRSEIELAGVAIGAMMARGGGLAASPINLVSGERCAFSHGAPTERTLMAGDGVNVEYGAAYRRYTATIGRQFHLGAPTGRQRDIYEIVRRACDACIAEIRDGAPAVAPHEAAKRIIGDAGFEHGRVHTTGYGLAPGFPPTWGEPLHMMDGSAYVLRAGMVISVEPPVFLGAEHFGARIIDNVLVTKDGCEILSRAGRDLVVV